MENTLKKMRQRVIYVVLLAFWTGAQFALTIAHYRQSPQNFEGIEIFMCALFLFGTIFWTVVVWRELKELAHPTN